MNPGKKSPSDAHSRRSPASEVTGKARTEYTDDERRGNSIESLTYESLQDHMDMRGSKPSFPAYAQVKCASNDTDSTYSSSRDSSEYEQHYRLPSQPKSTAKKSLPLIYFPKDHPFYQGKPPNSISNFDPRANTPATKNTCAQCHKSLSSTKTILKAMGNRYHPECFQCSHCSLSLEHAAFYPHDGKVYCHLDYHELFSPRCAYCQTPIEDEVITAMGSTYHAGHFFCAGCSKPFSSDESYHARDNYAWCHSCFTNKYYSKCWKCGLTIPEGDVIIKVLGRDWCSTCFACEYRNAPHRLVMMDSSYEMMGRLFA
ncbi:hypothetical protein V1525DRAFT_409330 [Lipomyces kononenkoae]|uniref:Uncharacterized protein n=1 Tax=Lipomyces kononenkoae TaxID=34357 RepID=A0ACC3SVR3_LIPKO